MSSIKIDIDNKTLQIRRGIEALYPDDKDYKLYEDSIVELMPLLKQISIHQKHDTNQEAKRQFDLFQDFLRVHKDHLPNIEDFPLVELNENILSVPFVLTYLKKFYTTVYYETNLLKPELAGPEYNGILPLHNKLHASHCDKWLDFMYARMIHKLEFPNGDYLRRVIKQFRNFDNIPEFMDTLQGIVFCVEHSEHEKASIIREYLSKQGISTDGVKMSTHQYFSEVYGFTLFYNLFLDKQLYLVILPSPMIIDDTLYSEMVVMDERLLLKTLSNRYSGLIVNCNHTFEANIENLSNQEELKKIKETIQELYNQLSEGEIGFKEAMESFAEYVKKMFNSFPKNKLSFVVETNNHQPHSIETLIEEADPKKFHETQLKAQAKDYDQKTRNGKPIRIIKTKVRINGLKKK